MRRRQRKAWVVDGIVTGFVTTIGRRKMNFWWVVATSGTRGALKSGSAAVLRSGWLEADTAGRSPARQRIPRSAAEGKKKRGSVCRWVRWVVRLLLLRRCDREDRREMRRMAATGSEDGPLQRGHQLIWLLRCWVVAATSSRGLALSLPRPAAGTAATAGAGLWQAAQFLTSLSRDAAGPIRQIR
jgi:hypothetical protein